MSKPPSRGTIYKNPTVNYSLTEGEESQYVSVDAAEIVIDNPYVCKALTQINSKEVKTHSATKETAKTQKFIPLISQRPKQFLINCYEQRSLNFGQNITFPRPKNLKE
ncbi:hypothetical protein ACFXTI_006692 [Malus domestica]